MDLPQPGRPEDVAYPRWGRRTRELIADTRGAQFVEYMILVAVVALLSIPAFVGAGAEMNTNIRALGLNAASGLPLMGF
jgi:Flp pilus assembly pilin Flp